ncbi:DUF58 domain-containing protein [Halococcus thailandensis]|uniref:DUF58 domain-containing protein n=1 Tax=Halococcus thailandensis JCM 13552 TaxID=1227457 RepID=M0MX12_9EURY|nr:DUF58 domain-containing protein [Halococcus thailandensis]EMA50277.1 hypothetical protein C451_17300 [Halococcus thailandensis JCM 13552]
MRPTRRAVALVGLVVLAVWLAVTFGARSLNALVVPALVALVAAAVQLLLADRPTIRRRPPAAGFPGETRRIELAVETDDPLAARLSEQVGDGLASTFDGATLSVPTTIEYEIGLRERGEQRLGPLTLTVTDAFGLLSRTFEYPRRTPVLVYPELHDVGDMGVVGGLAEHADERERFDGLREYVRGDSLRDVHWKSSAKRDDLVVMEFDGTRELTALTVAAEATAGHADEMASAAASVAVSLLDAGFAVALRYPGGEVERTGGEQQRERVLSALARAGTGRVEHEADLRVFTDDRGTRLTVDGREFPFESIGTAANAVATGRAES